MTRFKSITKRSPTSVVIRFVSGPKIRKHCFVCTIEKTGLFIDVLFITAKPTKTCLFVFEVLSNIKEYCLNYAMRL